MNKQKLIMENWRRFLREQEEDRGTRLPEDQVCLKAMIAPGEEAALILYKRGQGSTVEDQFDNLEIIGSIWVEKLSEEGPCLSGNGRGPAWHVKAIHTSDDHRRVGYGALLYGFAFLIAKQNNAALTSDKHAGTQPEAIEKWDQFKASSQVYSMAQTDAPYNSTEFDYKGVTPDPNDDCATYLDDEDEENATNHAFMHKNPEIYEAPMAMYEENHMRFMDELLPTQWVTEREFVAELLEKDNESFKDHL